MTPELGVRPASIETECPCSQGDEGVAGSSGKGVRGEKGIGFGRSISLKSPISVSENRGHSSHTQMALACNYSCVWL